MISVATDDEVEALGLCHSHTLGLTVKVLRSFVSKVLITIMRYVDLLETKLLAIGLDPTVMARGPTAAVLGLAMSALTDLFHRMAPP